MEESKQRKSGCRRRRKEEKLEGIWVEGGGEPIHNGRFKLITLTIEKNGEKTTGRKKLCAERG